MLRTAWRLYRPLALWRASGNRLPSVRALAPASEARARRAGVSIIIPTRDQPSLLARCLAGLAESTREV
ncbi:MAG: hypothetical protein ACYS22_12655, partial [Planctomycetota bacterium]